jgi:hypothetical protein
MQQVIEKLAQNAGVDLNQPGAHFTIYNEPYMRLAVERLDANRISVAHYFKDQWGDLCQDPDVVFYTNGTGWYPYQMQDTLGFANYVNFDDEGHPKSYSRQGQADLFCFCTQWALNISRQGFYDATDIRK